MSVLEKETEKDVGYWCKRRGILFLKVKFYDTGYPDRLFVYPTGQHVWWEAKREDKEPEPIQDYRLMDLVKHNAIAFWTDNYADTILVLQAVLDAPFVPEESDSAFALASIRRAILRSRTWKDQHLTRDLFDSEETRAREEDADSGPTETGL